MARFGKRLGGTRVVPGMILLGVVALTSLGCAKEDYTMADARGWSSQTAWEVIEGNDPNMIERLFGLLPDDMAEVAESAESSFAGEAIEASKSTPPGGLKLLLDKVRISFVPTVQSATAGLTEGASGIIVLGDFIGPDGQPLDNDVAAQVDVENFLDDLQTSDGVAGDWFIISLSPEQMENVLDEAGAQPGEAVKVGIYEFIYDPANIYYMELLVSSTPYTPKYMVTYTGNARLSQVQTRTKVPGRGNGEVKFFYQPFAKEWLDLQEENARQLKDAQLRQERERQNAG